MGWRQHIKELSSKWFLYFAKNPNCPRIHSWHLRSNYFAMTPNSSWTKSQ